MNLDKIKEKAVESRKLIFCILVSSLTVFTATSLSSAYEGDGIAEPGENKAEDPRRAPQNLMADLISFPTQKPTVNDACFLD